MPPKVELRLARLYRTAFARQQQRHLGLLSTDPRSRRDALLRGFVRRKVKYVYPDTNATFFCRFHSSKCIRLYIQSTPEHTEISSRVRVPPEKIPLNTTEIQSTELTINAVESSSSRAITEASVPNSPSAEDRLHSSSVSEVKSMKMIEVPRLKMLLPAFEETDDYEKPTGQDFVLKKIINTLRGDTKFSSSADDELTTVDPDSTNHSTSEPFPRESLTVFANPDNSRSNADIVSGNRTTNLNRNADESSSASANASVRSKLRLTDNSVPGIVKVRMQNTSVIEGGAMRLIYSVHLDGKPVPAETAAKDMALLSPQEVALELGAPVIIKSERE